MTKMRLIVLICFCATFSAGVGTGGVLGREIGRTGRRSFLGRALDLTPEQREKMREIWSSVRGESRRQRRAQRMALRQERDEAVLALLSEEQRLKYDEILREYEQNLEAMEEEGKKRFEEAVERTKAILTEAQRKKYEEFMASGPSHGPGPRPWGRGGRGRRPPGGEEEVSEPQDGS
ncbi:MAG: Spy/CpxP family protein refolding chaperone [Planctomycetota bacterium]|jgi:Spy/CpxP family protein refolding chaperone